MIKSLALAYIVFPNSSSLINAVHILANSLTTVKIPLKSGQTCSCKVESQKNISHSYNEQTYTQISHQAYQINYEDQNSSELFQQVYQQSQTKTIVHEDWICSGCQGHNFSRREDCYKCKLPKSEKSVIVPVIKQIQQTQKPLDLFETPEFPSYKTEYKDLNCLMLRGTVLKFETNTKDIKNLFEGFQIVEVRLVHDKLTNLNKDFAFIEFTSQQEAQKAYDQKLSKSKKPVHQKGNAQILFRNQPVSLSYSQNKQTAVKQQQQFDFQQIGDKFDSKYLTDDQILQQVQKEKEMKKINAQNQQYEKQMQMGGQFNEIAKISKTNSLTAMNSNQYQSHEEKIRFCGKKRNADEMIDVKVCEKCLRLFLSAKAIEQHDRKHHQRRKQNEK